MNNKLIEELVKVQYELKGRAHELKDHELYNYSLAVNKAIKTLKREVLIETVLDMTLIGVFWIGFFIVASIIYK